MKVKRIFFVLLSIFSIVSAKAQSNEFTYDSLYAGSVIIGGQSMDLPDFARWHYFAFDEAEGVIVKGKSEFKLAIAGGGVGTEEINAEWKARTDWDFAFHAYDLRTNSGAAGDGNAGALFISDTASAAAAETSLEAIYASLTVAPATGYQADEVLSGVFYQSLQSMPPPRATSLSLNAATRKAAEGEEGASADFAALSMQGGATENPMIIVLKTTSGKYVKIYLKQFLNEEGKPGFLKFEYEFIPLTSGIASAATSSKIKLYPNPVSENLYVSLSENADITIYNVGGALVKQLNAQSGLVNIPVSGWAKGTYVVKIDSGKENQTQKIILR